MIYLCRHGQTEFNVSGRRQGQADSPLTASGRAQAIAMGQSLAKLNLPDLRIYASPLGRALHSARLIAAELGQAAITQEPRLMEIGMGEWDGKTDAEIEAINPDLRQGLPPESWWFHSPTGETYTSFATRLAEAMAAIQADPSSVKIIVAHGVVSQVIRAQWAELTEAESHNLPVPQNAFFALHPDHSVTTVACAECQT